MQLVIFGNSGSGKSTLARAFASRHQLAHLDLDTIAWQPDQPGVREAADVSAAKLTTFLEAHPTWVIEGCYSGLIRQAASHASHLYFMNPGIAACQANCRARPWESHKYPTPEAQDANLPMLLDWVAAYATRDDEFSLAAHQALFREHAGPKTEVTSNARARALTAPA